MKKLILTWMSNNCFASGLNYGSLENSLSRLEIMIPAYQILHSQGAELPEPLMVYIYEDMSTVFYDLAGDSDEIGIDHIIDQNLKDRAAKLMPIAKTIQ